MTQGPLGSSSRPELTRRATLIGAAAGGLTAAFGATRAQAAPVHTPIPASLADPLVPPAQHGLALASLAQPVAADVRIQYHDQGHVVPGWTHSDMASTFASWL